MKTDGTYKEYLDSLQPGDTIKYIENRGIRDYPSIVTLTVIKRTPKQIVAYTNTPDFPHRYGADNGRRIGGNYFDGGLPKPATDEELQEARLTQKHFRAATALRDYSKWHNLPLAALEEIEAIIAKHTAKPEAKGGE